MKEKRNKLKVFRIMNQHGCWLEEENLLEDEAINFYQKQFTQERDVCSFALLDHISELISDEDNEMLGAMPNDEEIKKVVFSLNSNSAGGPNGLTGRFYQTCWDIVGNDVIRMVIDFFC